MRNNYLTTIALILSMTFVAGITWAQVTTDAHQKKKHIATPYFGFYHGRQLLDVGNNGYKCKRCESMNNGFVVRMPLVSHFKLEAGLQYNYTLGPNSILPAKKGQLTNRNSSITLPITIQYYIRPDKRRLRPFFGFGAMTNVFDQKQQFSLGDGSSYPSMAGTKYVSILFTQGITFAISTKIDITESIHFMPQQEGSSVGFSIGIGFRMP